MPYDPEAIARAKAWAAFNRWHLALKTMTNNVVILHTGPWERRERMFKCAEERLDAYVARRIEKGEKVSVLRPPYRMGQMRAVLEVNGKRLRVFFLEERGAWRVA